MTDVPECMPISQIQQATVQDEHFTTFKKYYNFRLASHKGSTAHQHKTIHHDIPIKPWYVIGTDVFQLNNKNYICLVDYHSKFPVIKRMNGLSADSLTAAVRVIFAEYGIPHTIMSDAGSNFISEKFKTFCNSLHIEQALSKQWTSRSLHQIHQMHYEKMLRLWW